MKMSFKYLLQINIDKQKQMQAKKLKTSYEKMKTHTNAKLDKCNKNQNTYNKLNVDRQTKECKPGAPKT